MIKIKELYNQYWKIRVRSNPELNGYFYADTVDQARKLGIEFIRREYGDVEANKALVLVAIDTRGEERVNSIRDKGKWRTVI